MPRGEREVAGPPGRAAAAREGLQDTLGREQVEHVVRRSSGVAVRIPRRHGSERRTAGRRAGQGRAAVGGSAYARRMRPVTDLQRRVAPFKVVSDYEPSGDQPAAIKEIVGGSRAASRTSCCSARPAPARRPRWRGWPSSCSVPSSCSSPTRPSPRSSPTSCASSSRTTRWSTSSPTTTTTSPRPTSPRPTPTSRRTPRSTRRSSGSGTAPPTACSPAATRSWSRRCRASTASAPRRSTSTGCCGSRSARSTTATRSCAGSWRSSTPATTCRSPVARSACAATPSRSSRSTRSSRSGSSSSATRSSG